MTRDGLLAETEPPPTCRRLETAAPMRSAKSAGALHLLLQSRGGRAYRRGLRDYRVYLAAGRRPDVLRRDLRILCPHIPFALIEATPEADYLDDADAPEPQPQAAAPGTKRRGRRMERTE